MHFALDASETTIIIGIRSVIKQKANIKYIKFQIFNKLKNNISNIINKNIKLFILRGSAFLYI